MVPQKVTYDFTGKTAFLTGAASGIGAATARRLVASGAKVAITDIDGAAAEALAAVLSPDGSQAIGLALDVADPAAVEAAVMATGRAFDGLHLAVNNAGIGGPSSGVGSFPLDQWRRTMSVNLDGVFFCLRAEFPVIAASGGGAIVNVASILGSVAVAGQAAYTASKHGVVGLTKAAALDGASDGIRVNAVGPGYIETPFLAAMDADRRAQVAARHPVGRLGTAEEVAGLILWLLSEDAAFTTGSYHAADGGYLSI
jgi:NAD(P)-dependent dehydrogenase (short-subunit alcohol dehydrogenase family)